mgnify:CR=1 FL=1
MSPRDLKAYGIYEGEQKTLEFESGIVIRGRVITGTRDLRGKILIISFDNQVCFSSLALSISSLGSRLISILMLSSNLFIKTSNEFIGFDFREPGGNKSSL